MTKHQVTDLEPGDTLAEHDGFMWDVVEVNNAGNYYTQLVLKVKYGSMTVRSGTVCTKVFRNDTYLQLAD